MLHKKDINTLSAPNFFPANTKRHSDTSHNNQQRKPILKKNPPTKNNEQVQNHSGKQNFVHHAMPDSTGSYEISSHLSIEQIRKIKNKKKSIFLELQQLQNSSRKKIRSNSKKTSFLSLGENEFNNCQIRNSKQEYKQSKIDILFSNSNIQDSFWNTQTQKQIDFDLPQKSFKTIKSSQVVQPQPIQPTSIRLQFKKPQLYEVQKSDRIIEKSDTKRQKRRLEEKTVDETSSQKSNYLSTASSNFIKKAVYYECESVENEGKGTFFTIKQTPPPTEKQLKNDRQRKQQRNKQKEVKRQAKNMKLRPTKQSSFLMKRNEIQQYEKVQNLKVKSNEQAQNLLITLNPISSQVLPQSMPLPYAELSGSFQEDFFQTINSYRFLNRLCYKVKKYLNFNINRQSYDSLVAQMTKVKSFTLLNAELELQTLDSYQNLPSNGITQFLQIIQEYIDKQKKQPHWRHSENEFLRVTNSPFSLNDKIITFLEQTLPYFEQQLKNILPDLEKNLRTKETLSIQLKFKLLKHLLYDVVKMNLFEQRQLPVSIKAKESKKQRLIALIEKDKWSQKIQFDEIPSSFKQLKKDFSHFSF